MLSVKRYYAPILLLVATLMIVSGCAGVGQRLESPRVKLASIQVKEVKGLETAFEIQLRVFNTNEAALNIKGIECELELNEDSFAVGVSKADIEIAAFDTQIVSVTVYTSVIDMVKGIHNFQKDEQIQYELSGKLSLGGNSFPSVIPFSAEGIISFKNLLNREKQI
jgi:LEA14-like dessication related protein